MSAVIFDLDGTLIHSAPDLHAAANKMLAEEGEAPLDLETITSFIGNGLPKLVERVLEARGISPSQFPRLNDRMREIYNAAPADLTEPYPGVCALLEGLKTEGHKLAVCTNKPEEPARLILNLLDLERHFDLIVGGDTLAQKKPDPAPLLHAARALGEAQAVYVGDSEVDAATAQAAGLPFALFTGGYRKTPVADLPHDVAFDDFRALRPLLATLLLPT